MIDRKLIIANAPQSIGDEIHINHAGCTAGTDHRKRLYIKRDIKGVVAYCHHCNESGFASDSGSRLGQWLRQALVKEEPPQRIPDIEDEIPMAGKLWLSKYHCKWGPPYFYGVKRNPHKVALSLKNIAGETIGIQTRNLDAANTKYITSFYNQRNRSEGAWFYKSTDTIVITEDYLSAYRIHQDTNISSVALLRTSITDVIVQQIYTLKFKVIYLWLDPDKAGRQGAAKVGQKLKYYLPKETLVIDLNLSREAKQYAKDELSGLLNNPPV